VLPLAVLAVFFVYPVATLVGRGLVGPAGLDLSGFADVLSRPRFRRILLFTLGQAAASAALATVLGVPGAYVLYRCRFRGRAVVRAVVTVPFVLPTVVVALAFRTLFAPGGWLGSWGWDGTLAAILAAHVFLNYAVVVRTVGTTWAQLDDRGEQAARSLGANPVRVFGTVTLPALGPALAGAFTMVFLFCATSFGIILIMGGGRLSTLETEIYRQTMDFLDLRTAAVLSIVQVLLVTAVLIVSGVLRRRTEATLRLRSSGEGAHRVRAADLPAVLVTGLVLLGMAIPLAVLVVRSLQTPSGWGLDNYRALTTLGNDNVLLVPVTTALANSIRAASIATVLAVSTGTLLSVVLARRPRGRAARAAVNGIDAAVMLPLGVSAVTVGFGFLIALDAPPLDLRGSPLLVPIAQATVALPLVVRMILPVLRAADDRLRQAAAVLGAGPLRVWTTVDLPIMSRALIGASAFGFAVALGEFGATSFLASPLRITLPLVIARLVGRPGVANTGTALAAAVVLALLCLVAVLIVELAGGRRDLGGPAGF
jgi:thiamine transport system permease protein